jgi:membrane associated rhomboid family serine protease
VPAQEHERALEVIRLYRTENLHWPWRRKISSHDFLFDWGALAWVFLIVTFFWLDERDVNLHDAGLMRGVAVSQGEWWRLFTAIFLHADLSHLAANAGIGLVLLGLAMGAYGTGVGLLAALLAGAGGNVLRLMINDGQPSLGASGMVMGALGLLAVRSVSLWRKNPNALKYIFSGLAAGVMLFVLLGTDPNSDVIAHFGGFVSGILIGGVLMLKPRLTRNTLANIIAGTAFCLLVVLVWWLALSGKIPTENP